MNTQSPFKAHKGGRNKKVLVRASQAEIDKLNAIRKARKEKGFARSSQADVLFMGIGTIGIGKEIFEYRQRLCDNIQAVISNKQVVRELANNRPWHERELTQEEETKLQYLDGCKDAYQRMRNELDGILASFNQ